MRLMPFAYDVVQRANDFLCRGWLAQENICAEI